MFRQWLGADRGISEEEWKTLIEEDEAFDNEIHGVGREEVNVEHDIGTEPTCVYCSQSHPSLSCQRCSVQVAAVLCALEETIIKSLCNLSQKTSHEHLLHIDLR